MEKGTISLFVATAIITVAIIGGLYLSDRAQRSAQSGASEEGGWTTLFSSPFSRNEGSSPSSRNGQSPHSSTSRNGQSPYPGTTNTQYVSAETSSVDGVLVCNHPEHGTIYTNAATCEEADLDNRLSIAESFVPIPGQDHYSRKNYQSAQDSSSNTRSNRNSRKEKPNIRLIAKALPSGLPQTCKFPMGKALEIERVLAAKTDPSKSIWRDSYCRWVSEARKKNCPIEDDLFYYGNLCPWYR